MPREPKTSRKTGVRTPKVSRKTKQAARLPPPEDDDDTEDQDWIGDLRQYLQQHLVSRQNTSESRAPRNLKKSG